MCRSDTSANGGMLLSGLAAAVFAASASAGVDIKVNTTSPAASVQNEVRLAIDPGNSLNLVAAYNNQNGQVSPNSLGISYSSDGGATWGDTTLTGANNPFAAPNTPFTMIFDPAVGSAPGAGDFFAAYIGADAGAAPGGGGGASGLFVDRSTTGGMTWTGPTLIDSNPAATLDAQNRDPNYRFNDRVHIDLDPVSVLHATWIKDVDVGQPTSDIYYNFANAGVPAGVGNTGLTFGASIIVNDGFGGTDEANAPYVSPHPNGDVWIAWIDYDVTVANDATGRIMADRGTGGGPATPPTFGTDILVQNIDPLPRNVTTSNGVTDVIAKSGPVIVADGNDGTGNTAYIAYAAEDPANNDQANIYFTATIDGGLNWSGPIKINDDSTNHDQIHPAMIVKPDGTIDIAWYDKRHALDIDGAGPDDGDDAWDVYIARSTDFGNTFSANLRVSDFTFPSTTDSIGNPWLGEYLGLVTDGSDALLAWTSQGNPSFGFDSFGDIYFDRIPNASIPEPGTMAMLLTAGGALALRRRSR